jgi:very-short-patch-repair endonuclease
MDAPGFYHYTSHHMTDRARQLRHDATTTERLLWGLLRGGRLAGLKFRRQYPVGPFVVDFYCHTPPWWWR